MLVGPRWSRGPDTRPRWWVHARSLSMVVTRGMISMTSTCWTWVRVPVVGAVTVLLALLCVVGAVTVLFFCPVVDVLVWLLSFLGVVRYFGYGCCCCCCECVVNIVCVCLLLVLFLC